MLHSYATNEGVNRSGEKGGERPLCDPGSELNTKGRELEKHGKYSRQDGTKTKKMVSDGIASDSCLVVVKVQLL